MDIEFFHSGYNSWLFFKSKIFDKKKQEFQGPYFFYIELHFLN